MMKLYPIAMLLLLVPSKEIPPNVEQLYDKEPTTEDRNFRPSIGQPHLGSEVIMLRYEYPEVLLSPRAAKIVDGPFICPIGTPNEGEICADIVWWINERGVDPENTDPTLSDWRKNVLYDPTGLTPRSYHVYGEGPGEN